MHLKQFHLLTMSLALSFLAACAVAQQARPKVGIKSFRNPSNYSRSSIGNGLTDILSTELGNTGKFNIIDREHIDELTKEIDFGNSGYGDKETFAQKGNLLGVQYLLMGEVTNFSYTEQRGQPRNKVNLLGPNTIVVEFQKQADVRVDFHLIEVATGEHVIDEAGNGHAADKSETSDMDTWRRIISSSGTFESSSSLIGRATMDAVKDIVRKLSSLSDTIGARENDQSKTRILDNLSKAKGEIAAEEGGGLWIVGGIGNANGLMVGDHLRIVHENLVKDKAGRVIYRKPVELGSMEVTDVSQPDHAEARFIAVAGGNAPQANDSVTIDMEVAKRIRDIAPSKGGDRGSGGGGTDDHSSTSRAEETIKRADGFVRDKFWSQALAEYGKAAAIDPNEPRVLQGQALSHYMLGDFIEGDEVADRLLQGGGTFGVPIAHFHPMGLCTGELKIQRGKLVYSTSKGDGFGVGPQGLSGIEVKKIAKGMMANEKLPDWPIINIRWRDGGHDKDYQMLPYGYSREQILSGKNLASGFPMEDSDVQQMQKLEESLVALILKYVK
jgi:curli biogenesis system outer membrane secretion channel CsgG